jgi:hypothetical protein
MTKSTGPKVLLLDIETAPLLVYCWGIWDQNIGLNQIESDWHVLSWSAKWLGDPDENVMYADQRNARDIENDKAILKQLWKLLNDADVIITQNGKSFDEKKLNARFILNGMGPPSPYRHIDTKRIASKKFAFTSNKLEYMTKKLCKKKKLSHKQFPGFELWRECLKGNIDAWEEMRLYNIMDVLSLEELYKKLQPWDRTIVFSAYSNAETMQCNCGNNKLQKRGFNYSNTGKFQRYFCTKCGSWYSGRTNLLSKEKRSAILK